MVRVSVYFEMLEKDTSELRRHCAEVFLPAVREQPGFLECVLLSPVAGDHPGHRLDITFGSEEQRQAWVESPLHDRVFEPMAQLAVGVRVELHSAA